MAEVCEISGEILDSAGNPVVGAVLYASPIIDSAIMYDTASSYYKGCSVHPIKCVTDALGSFKITLLQKCLFRIAIRYIGLDENILVPELPVAVLWDLIGIEKSATVTSTGEVIPTGGSSAGW